MLKEVKKIDYTLSELSKELFTINCKYTNYLFVLVDCKYKTYMDDLYKKFNSNCKDYADCLKDIETAFGKLLKDKDLYLDYRGDNRWEIISQKLNLIITNDRKLTSEEIEKVKEKYTIGTRIKLNHMFDNYSVPRGTYGTVDFVDDEGQIHMNWDNGRTLALVPNLDNFEIIEKGKNLDNDMEVRI